MEEKWCEVHRLFLAWLKLVLVAFRGPSTAQLAAPFPQRGSSLGVDLLKALPV
jgi:hypothetical protein